MVLEYVDGSTLIIGRNTSVTLRRVNKFSDSGLADSEVRIDSGRTENRVKNGAHDSKSARHRPVPR